MAKPLVAAVQGRRRLGRPRPAGQRARGAGGAGYPASALPTFAKANGAKPSTGPVASAIGERRALELCLTGRIFSTPDALAWGLVHMVAPAFELDDRASEIAMAVANAAPEAISAALDRFQR